MKTLEATSIQPAAPTQPWKVPGFTSTLIAVAAAFSAFSLMLPVIPLAVIASGQSDALAGATTATFMAITVLTQICTSRLIHAFGYRAVMIVAALLLGLPSLWYAVSLDPASVLIVAAIRGIGFGSLCVAQYALIGEIVPAGMLGKASGLLGVAVGASQMVALPAGLLLVDAGYSFDVVFFVGGGIALIAAFMAIAIPNVESDASSADAAGNDEAGVAIDDPAWRRAELKYERRQRIIHSKVVQKAKFAIPAKPRAKNQCAYSSSSTATRFDCDSCSSIGIGQCFYGVWSSFELLTGFSTRHRSSSWSCLSWHHAFYRGRCANDFPLFRRHAS